MTLPCPQQKNLLPSQPLFSHFELFSFLTCFSEYQFFFIDFVKITFAGGSGRRLLGVLSLDLTPGIVSIGKKLQLYPVPCENPSTSPGHYVETMCDEKNEKLKVQVCSKTGWKVVLDECSKISDGKLF